MYGAAQGGHLALLTSLVGDSEESGDDLVEVVRRIILCGAEYGHLDVVKLGLRIAKVGPISANLRIEEFSDSSRVASFHRSLDITTSTSPNGVQLGAWELCRLLAKAARGGFTTIVQTIFDVVLLDIGVDFNEDCFVFQEPPLEAAAQAGRAETVRSLLDRGASIEGHRGLRAVTAAVKRGWLGVVDMLCDEGIVIAGTEKSWLESNPMLTSMKYDQAHIIDFLLRKNVASIDRSSIDPCFGGLKNNTEDMIAGWWSRL